MRHATISFSKSPGGRNPADTAACPVCSHPMRLHNAVGCVRGECECLEVPAGREEATVAPPVGRALDVLDPPCADCTHRRGRHVVNGTGLPCRDCDCRNFALEATDAPATTPGPAPAVAAAPTGTPAGDEAGPDGPAAGATGRAGFGLGLKTPRQSAAVGGDDADEEVAAVVPSTRAAATSELLDRIGSRVGQRRRDAGLSQDQLGRAAGVTGGHLHHIEAGKRNVTLGVLEAVAGVLGCDVADLVAPEPAAAAPSTTAAALDDLAVLVNAALVRAHFYAARWYCASCISWPLASGVCPTCRGPLQPVYLATLPREM